MTSRIILLLLALASAGSFTWYGLACLFSLRSRREYRRYGIPQLRVMNGTLMLLGSGGILLGLLFWPLGFIAAACLCTMMVLGVLARIRLGDSARLMVPAASLATLNFVIAILFGIT